MFRPFKVIDLYKSIIPLGELFPDNTGFDFWDEVYPLASAEYDREFARRFKNFLYFDFLEAEEVSDALTNFKADVLSILTFNQKRYAEMYRVFVVSDEEDPITYNYDMTETTGKQKQTTDKGAQTNSIGAHTDIIGEQTNTHNVSPFNETAFTAESQDVTAQRSDTIGAHTDTEGARQDIVQTDEWTLTRKGNIGVQTAADILRLHTEYWTEHYKFFNLIFEDIAKQLLLVGE